MVRSLDRQAPQRASQPRSSGSIVSIPMSPSTEASIPASSSHLPPPSSLRRSSRTAAREANRPSRIQSSLPPPQPRRPRPRASQAWSPRQSGNNTSSNTTTGMSTASRRRISAASMPGGVGSSSSIATTSHSSNSAAAPVRRRVGALTLPAWSNSYSHSSNGMSYSGSSTQATVDNSVSHTDALSSLHSFFSRELHGIALESTSSSRQDQKAPKRAKTFKHAEAQSDAFHHSDRARCKANMFEKLPTEILCTILEYVVQSRDDKPTANDDGDGPKVGNPLQYWYMDKDRCLLRLVCRSWNQTILAMAREINIALGADESMNALLQLIASNKSHGTSSQPSGAQRTSHIVGNGGSSATNTRPAAESRTTRMPRRSQRLQGSSASLSASSMPVPPFSRLSTDWEWSFSTLSSRVRQSCSDYCCYCSSLQCD